MLKICTAYLKLNIGLSRNQPEDTNSQKRILKNSAWTFHSFQFHLNIKVDAVYVFFFYFFLLFYIYLYEMLQKTPGLESTSEVFLGLCEVSIQGRISTGFFL